MNKIELLASELAFLSNASLQKISEALVRDYPTRAEAFDTTLQSAFQDHHLQNSPDIWNSKWDQ